MVFEEGGPFEVRVELPPMAREQIIEIVVRNDSGKEQEFQAVIASRPGAST
jgi:hypothetical protein